MPDGRDNEVIRAAGAVVWRPGPAGPELALVHRPSYDDWSYPKGKSHRDEHVLTTAIREVTEETGQLVILGRPLESSNYLVGDRAKEVRYWVARCTEPASFVPNQEVDQLAWLPAEAARERLTYQRDVALLAQFRSGPAKTVPFIVLRHAVAKGKAADGVHDLSRPLTSSGAADAKLLADLLAAYGRCRVISSPAERCLATVRPYAALAGVPVEIEPAFGILQKSMTPELARQAARRAATLAASGIPTVLCAHRENLPGLIEAVAEALGGKPPAGRPLRKGAFWVFQSAGGVLVSAERHDVSK